MPALPTRRAPPARRAAAHPQPDTPMPMVPDATSPLDPEDVAPTPPAGERGAAPEGAPPPPPPPQPGRGLPASDRTNGAADEGDAEDDEIDPGADRPFAADPSFSLPGVQEVERPRYGEGDWVDTRGAVDEDRPEPIPGQVEGAEDDSLEADAEAAAAVDPDHAQRASGQAAAAAAMGRGLLHAVRGEDEPAAGLPPLNTPDDLARALEALLFVSAKPISADRLKDLLGLDSLVPVRQAMDRLAGEYERRGRAFELAEVAHGYLVQTRPAFDPLVLKLQRARQEQRISPAALVTLAIVAYKQPLTRSEVDAVRGVGSSHHIRALVERGLVKVVGRKPVPGAPSLYGTTSQFLLQFGLRNLRDLPQEADFDEHDPAAALDQLAVTPAATGERPPAQAGADAPGNAPTPSPDPDATPAPEGGSGAAGSSA